MGMDIDSYGIHTNPIAKRIGRHAHNQKIGTVLSLPAARIIDDVGAQGCQRKAACDGNEIQEINLGRLDTNRIADDKITDR